jgi:hypothetical protein
MAKRKTQQTEASVDEFIDSIQGESKRADCHAITLLMQAATGQEAKMWAPALWALVSVTTPMQTESPQSFAKWDSLRARGLSPSTCLNTQSTRNYSCAAFETESII